MSNFCSPNPEFPAKDKEGTLHTLEKTNKMLAKISSMKC